MNLRQQKISRLKTSQNDLRDRKTSVSVLRVQQQALKQNLLRKMPFKESSHERVLRLRRDQSIRKKLALKRKKEREERERVLKKLKRKTIRGFYFPELSKTPKRR